MKNHFLEKKSTNYYKYLKELREIIIAIGGFKNENICITFFKRLKKP
jgi:hypothetical protein